MTRFLPALTLFGLLGAATLSSASCRWFGTQIECQFGEGQLSLGTQVADEPRYGTALRPLRLNGSGGYLDIGLVSRWPIRFDIQNIGADPRLCQTIGNERYCR